VRVGSEGGPASDHGTRLLSALDEAAAEVAQDRIAGALLVTDGRSTTSTRWRASPPRSTR
jgi:hypothetical protein